MALVTIEEYSARQDEIRSRLRDIDSESAGSRLSDEVRAEWNDLNDELDENAATIEELRARQERVLEISGENRHVERPGRRSVNGGNGKARRVPDNVFAVEEYRNLSASEDEHRQALADGAKMILERATFPHPAAKREEQQAHIEGLIDRLGSQMDPETGTTFARRFIETSSPTYVRAWGKNLAGKHLSADEQRSLGIGSQGGNFPVPIVLDPTVVLTSNGQVNPIRLISRVETIVGNTWNGVLSAGITAGYGAEFTEASDNSPTLTQPSANVEKAFAFVPFSIEAGEDWASLQSQMAVMLQDAKDALEANKFLAGAGHGSSEPQGLLVGATAVINTAATATFAAGDVYSLEEALAPRWQARASIISSKHYLNKVRQFDTAGGAQLWAHIGDGTPARLLDYPTFQHSTMNTAGTSGASIVTIGDFSQFVIVDRIGMNIELIPHLFATANNRPSGSRGIYAHWRNTSFVNTQLAFKTLKLL